MTVATRTPCGPFCTPACRAADAELHEARSFLDPPEDEGQVIEAMLAQTRLDIADPGPAAYFVGGHDHGPAGECPGVIHEHIEGGYVDDCDRYPGPDHRHELIAPPATHSGQQLAHDIRAVQLRPENFSPAMIEKAGRLYVQGWRTHGPNDFEIASESSDDWYLLRVWETTSGIWFATCNCPARASRWNRAGACAHRALAGYLRAEQTGKPIPKWQDLDLEAAE